MHALQPINGMAPRMHWALLLLVVAVCASSVPLALGKGGSRSSSSRSRSSGRSSTSRRSSAASSGRLTRSGAAVPIGCRSCFYNNGLFYNRVFLYSYMGRTRQCHGCGGREGHYYDPDQALVQVSAVQGNLTVAFPSKEAADAAVSGSGSFAAELGAHVS